MNKNQWDDLLRLHKVKTGLYRFEERKHLFRLAVEAEA
jgi:hypothetical protein